MTDVALVSNVLEYTGPGTVAALKSAGYRVICHDRQFTDAAARTRFERANPGCRALEHQDATELAETAISRFGRVDVLVSNDMYKIEDCDGPMMPWMMQTLLMPAYDLTTAIIPQMIENGGGRIVLVTSGTPSRAPQRVWPDNPKRNRQQLCYNVTRSGVNTMARFMARQYAPDGIQVNAVAPSYVYSDTFFPNSSGPDDPALADIIEQFVPMGRFGQQSEIGELIAFLVSGKAQFVSGQIIGFNGAGI